MRANRWGKGDQGMATQKTHLIFGGIGGIGGSLAADLAAQGHQVFVTTSKPERQALSPLPERNVLHVDVLDPGSIKAAVDMASRDGLHGLAYCVGSIDLKPLARTTPDDLMRSFQLNAVGAFLAVKAAAAALGQSRGSVVLFSSIAASRGFSNHSAIGTAKAAVEGLAKSMAAELAPNVRINVIAPSLTDTPLAHSLTQNPRISETIAAMHPIPRLGNANEMAKAASFLLSDDSSWITGQIFHIDGGRSTLEKAK